MSDAHEISITVCWRDISARLTDAAAIAKAAVTCMEAGSENSAVRIALDLEELLHDANRLLGAVSLLQRSAETLRRHPAADSS